MPVSEVSLSIIGIRQLKYLRCFLVTAVDCKSQCNTSKSLSTPTTSQLPVVAMNTVSLISTGFIQVHRSPTGRCPRRKPCAATLRASPGQRINVTLWDFTMRDDRRLVARQKTHAVETCYRCAAVVFQNI